MGDQERFENEIKHRSRYVKLTSKVPVYRHLQTDDTYLEPTIEYVEWLEAQLTTSEEELVKAETCLLQSTAFVKGNL